MIEAGAIERVTATADDLVRQYRKEVKWPLGLRIGADSRLLLLTLNRLLNRMRLSPAERRSPALYVGGRAGSLDNYASFDAALSRGELRPMAYAYALPSIPLACAGLALSLTGPAYSVMGDATVGIDAAQLAAIAVTAGQVDRAIVIAISIPFEPGDDAFAALAFVMTPAMAAAFARQARPAAHDPSTPCPVRVLESFLADIDLGATAAGRGFRRAPESVRKSVRLS